jgi:hypothetical protein
MWYLSKEVMLLYFLGTKLISWVEMNYWKHTASCLWSQPAPVAHIAEWSSGESSFHTSVGDITLSYSALLGSTYPSYTR